MVARRGGMTRLHNFTLSCFVQSGVVLNWDWQHEVTGPNSLVDVAMFFLDHAFEDLQAEGDGPVHLAGGCYSVCLHHPETRARCA